ncbi:hypothetical protein GLOTRDRAFT_34534, partial [Gloeophyllum trabeum ATCC 11539]
SDFLLVRSSRIKTVMRLLSGSGFDLYTEDTENLTNGMSPIVSPTGRDDDGDEADDFNEDRPMEPTSVPSRPPPASRTSSHSPAATDVQILDPDLTCVGLADDAAETWTLKIVKLVAYPDLIPGVVARKSDDEPYFGTRNRNHSVSESSSSKSPFDSTAPIPFFSFTRTQESSSLTTDVSVLAQLFPAPERHMVICSGELDVADHPVPPSFEDAEDEDEQASPEASSLMKCLQIDLRKYGLDKHGLVNRFSRVLDENGVNHMYSSTFMSANLLVRVVRRPFERDCSLTFSTRLS